MRTVGLKLAAVLSLVAPLVPLGRGVMRCVSRSNVHFVTAAEGGADAADLAGGDERRRGRLQGAAEREVGAVLVR
jgi:hypothetical protein